MNTITNRQVICETLSEAAKTDHDIIVLCSDSRGSASMGPFVKQYPEQFVEVREKDICCVSGKLPLHEKL